MVKVFEIESSLNTSYKRGDRIKKGAFLGLKPGLDDAVFSPFSGRIKFMTLNVDKDVVCIEIEESEDDCGTVSIV